MDIINTTEISNFTLKLLNSNVTLKNVANFFDVSVANVTNQSEVTQLKLFDLYEAYKLQEREQLIAYQYVAIIVGTLIILANLVVVISSGLILRMGQQPKNTYLLLGNVSLADTIIGFSLIFGTVINNTVTSNPLCMLQIGLIVCPIIVSIFSVGLIAVDRYIYILHGLYYQRWFSTTRVRIGILIIWFIGLTLGFMPATGWTNNELGYTGCSYISLFPGALIFFNALLSIVPIIIVAILYSIILARALKNVKEINTAKKFVQTNDGSNQKPNLRIYRGTGILVACLPAMGWTGETFRNYRCWYIAVFPPAMLIIVSIIVLSVIVMVCILYFLILRSAVRTVDKIKEFQGINKISFIETKFDSEISRTLNMTDTNDTDIIIELQEIAKEKLNYKEKGNSFKEKAANIASCYNKAKIMNAHPTKFKAIKTVLIVTACFLGTWGPYYVAIIVYVKCDIVNHGYDCVPLEILTLGPLYMLGITNSLFDPLIYAWRHAGFKRTVQRIYWKCILNMRVRRLFN